MQCQQCHKNQATIRMNLQINQKMKQYYFCHECYSKMGAKSGSLNSMWNPFGNNGHFDFIKPSSNGVNTINDQESNGILEQVGRNLSIAATTGAIDPVIGRDREVERVIEILNRRNKNNPVLIGEPGVGKTAIAEGLALKIAEGQVPSKLKDKIIFTLDVVSLVSGTGIRGEFEEKMKQIITELQNRKNVILFIDEIHLLVGAGSAQGSMDAGNILKPALARGDIKVIGATTLKEYRQIEKDAALERRFQPVMVAEANGEEAFEILNGLRSKYEEYHQVKFTDEVLRACVTLSQRYIQDRFLPDKAIDLLDEAGSMVNLRGVSKEHEQLKQRLIDIHSDKKQAITQENYEKAAQLRKEEEDIENKLNQIQDSSDVFVTIEDIQKLIERKTGILVSKLQEAEQDKMKNLAERLAAKVIGQEKAVQKIAKAIRRSRAGLKSKQRPIGSFLFVGPTGVGKTELTKCLAEELFGDRNALIRLDMSEYMEKHAVSKLIGSPPGYVGHDEAGQLTERVRRNPYSIILLDEIEKAHPDVLNVFLQVLEDGRLTDSQGRTVNFKDTVIIATSNAGVTEKTIKVGFEQPSDEKPAVVTLGAYFRPEFLNRFDSIVSFEQLTSEDLSIIVGLMLSDTKVNLMEQGIDVEISDEAIGELAELGYDPQFGARPLRRVIQEKVEDQIADLIMEEEKLSSLRIDVENGVIIVKAI